MWTLFICYRTPPEVKNAKLEVVEVTTVYLCPHFSLKFLFYILTCQHNKGTVLARISCKALKIHCLTFQTVVVLENQSDSKCTVFVSNLNYTVSDDQIKQFFTKASSGFLSSLISDLDLVAVFFLQRMTKTLSRHYIS